MESQGVSQVSKLNHKDTDVLVKVGNHRWNKGLHR